MTKEEREKAIDLLDNLLGMVEDNQDNDYDKALKMGIESLRKEPSEDAVSRKAIVEMLNARGQGSVMTFDHFIELLYELPPVTPTQRWISVDKELPKENVWDDGYVEPSDYVLVFGDCGEYGVSRYWGNRKSKVENPNSYKDWMDLDWIAQKPIAWLPLPKPYKETENKDGN